MDKVHTDSKSTEEEIVGDEICDLCTLKICPLTSSNISDRLLSRLRLYSVNLRPYRVGYGYQMKLDPIFEKGMGFFVF